MVTTNKSLQDTLNESLSCDASPEEYRKLLQKENSEDYKGDSQELTKGNLFHNPPEKEHTGNRIAFGGISWIEYWQRMSGYNDIQLRCTFCGKEIFSDIDSPQCMDWRIAHPEERNYRTKDDYQAVGGHLYKNGKDNSDGFIIIPICKDCNAKAESYDLKVVVPNAAVDEIGATVKR